MVGDEEDWSQFIDGLRLGKPEVVQRFWEQYRPTLERIVVRNWAPWLVWREGNRR